MTRCTPAHSKYQERKGKTRYGELSATVYIRLTVKYLPPKGMLQIGQGFPARASACDLDPRALNRYQETQSPEVRRRRGTFLSKMFEMRMKVLSKHRLVLVTRCTPAHNKYKGRLRPDMAGMAVGCSTEAWNSDYTALPSQHRLVLVHERD